MSDRVLVTVHLPAAYKSFEVMIPLQARMKDIQDTLAVMLSELSEELFLPSQTTMLLDRSTGNRIGIDATAEELQLKNGSQLVLI